jgi:hypothetical protein
MNGESSAECQNVLKNYQALGGEAHAFICAATTGEIEYGLNTSPKKAPPPYTMKFATYWTHFQRC